MGNKERNFLDIDTKISGNNKFKFDIYRKSMYTGIITLNDSHHPIQYKLAAINTVCYRRNNCIEDKEGNKNKEIEIEKLIVKNITNKKEI